MTKREAAIVSAYTGVLCGEPIDLIQYAEELTKQRIWHNQLEREGFWSLLKVISEDDFNNLSRNIKE